MGPSVMNLWFPDGFSCQPEGGWVPGRSEMVKWILVGVAGPMTVNRKGTNPCTFELVKG